MLFARLLARLIRQGDLTVVDACGIRHRFGGPPIDGVAPVTIRLHDRRLHERLFVHPRLLIGEAFVDGTLTIEDGTLYDFLAICGNNTARAGEQVGPLDALLWLGRRFQQFNPLTRARHNVAHHYDLSEKLFALFLDADRQYSCAYFAEGEASLEAAQEAKKRHIARKLLLGPGQRVLDIGSGWGGMALTLARLAEVDVTGITLSREQLALANRRAQEAQLAHRVRFRLEDWRRLGERFERVVSVGMFEHVGINHYRQFFTRLRDLLTEDGIAVLHAIGRAGGPGVTNPWMRKYIFPGGYAPALSEVLPPIERSGLAVTDIEILKLHYADTLREWRRRFQFQRAEAAALYDERFCRMWEFYLAASEIAFRFQDHMVFQIQLARDHDDVPRSRDYMYPSDFPRD